MPVERLLRVLGGWLLLLLVTASCALRSPSGPPEPGWERGAAPDLTARTVLVLPVQEGTLAGEPLDREIAFALRSRGGDRVTWRDTSDLDGITAGAGAMSVDPFGLDVGTFHRGEVERVGDPLYGEQYRLAAFTGADLVLLPIEAHTREQEGGDPSVVLNAALLEPRSGRVLWQGILEGASAPEGSPAAAASAAERLAARLLP